MTTINGSPTGFIIAGIVVAASSPLWARLFTWICNQLVAALTGQALPGEDKNVPLTRAFIISTICIGLIMIAVGLASR